MMMHHHHRQHLKTKDTATHNDVTETSPTEAIKLEANNNAHHTLNEKRNREREGGREIGGGEFNGREV